LQLLFRPRRTRKLHFRSVVVAVAILVQSDDWARPVVDLLFVPMGGVLDLAALITLFNGGKNVFPALLEAAEVCSLGQITGRLQEVVGRFRPMV